MGSKVFIYYTYKMATVQTLTIQSEMSMGKHIEYVMDGDNNIVVKDNEMVNPYYISIGKNNTIDYKQRHHTETVYIHCMRNEYKNEKEAEIIYNKVIDKTDFNKLSKYFTLVKCSGNILLHNEAYKMSLLVDSKYMEFFNHNKYMLTDKEVVVMMYNMYESDTIIYKSIFSAPDYNIIREVINIVKLHGKYSEDLIIDNVTKLLATF